MRKNKYNNRSVTHDGIKFHSAKEGNRYLYLKNEQLKGRISGLICQPRFNLFPKDKTNLNENIRAINYTADFQYQEGENTIVEDVKGIDRNTGKPVIDQASKLRINLFKRKYKDLEFRIV